MRLATRSRERGLASSYQDSTACSPDALSLKAEEIGLRDISAMVGRTGSAIS